MKHVFRSRSWYLLVIIMLGFLVISSSCPNKAPTVTVTANPASVYFGQTSQLTATVDDPEGDTVTYSWTSTSGTFTTATTGATVTWQAPNTAGTYTVTVTVGDGENTVSTNTAITVTAPPAQWIMYDDGVYEDYFETDADVWFALVLFDRPTGWVDYTITRVKIHFNTDGDPDGIKPCLWDTQYASGNYWPNSSLHCDAEAEHNVTTGWNEMVVNWPTNLERFCAGYLQYYYATDPDPSVDESDPDTRSYLLEGADPQNLNLWLFSDIDWAIQVYVEHSAAGASGGNEGMWLEGNKVSIKDFEETSYRSKLSEKKQTSEATGLRKKF
jgi:hypothetical protein